MDVAIDRRNGLGEGVPRFPRVLFSLLFVAGLVVYGSLPALRTIAIEDGSILRDAPWHHERAGMPCAVKELRNRHAPCDKAGDGADTVAVLARVYAVGLAPGLSGQRVAAATAPLQQRSGERVRARAPPHQALLGAAAGPESA